MPVLLRVLPQLRARGEYESLAAALRAVANLAAAAINARRLVDCGGMRALLEVAQSCGDDRQVRYTLARTLVSITFDGSSATATASSSSVYTRSVPSGNGISASLNSVREPSFVP